MPTEGYISVSQANRIVGSSSPDSALPKTSPADESRDPGLKSSSLVHAYSGAHIDIRPVASLIDCISDRCLIDIFISPVPWASGLATPSPEPCMPPRSPALSNPRNRLFYRSRECSAATEVSRCSIYALLPNASLQSCLSVFMSLTACVRQQEEEEEEEKEGAVSDGVGSRQGGLGDMVPLIGRTANHLATPSCLVGYCTLQGMFETDIAYGFMSKLYSCSAVKIQFQRRQGG
ncbi:unnamed protein product [Protopolystoma xenopodis]|uniref:Uncharacterized protein n=1 Tax=Protopolystoma xenopodis TaxID=117903 RepID=A0A448XKZ2_9PLAT|nr:unnamed protein product [Protopolystoma xenopodis]